MQFYPMSITLDILFQLGHIPILIEIRQVQLCNISLVPHLHQPGHTLADNAVRIREPGSFKIAERDAGTKKREREHKAV